MMQYLWFLSLTIFSGAGAQLLRGSVESFLTPYDDLLKCMWNGTTVTSCHAIHCSWCHSTMSDICVTPLYASYLDGSVFHCEGPAPSTDDDAATDDAVTPEPGPTPKPTPHPRPTARPTPAPTSLAPTPVPDDDAVNPVDDDDPNQPANKQYMKRLLHCLAIEGGASKCAADKLCRWCTYGHSQGMCFSHQAAHQMDGAYYDCGYHEEDGTVMEYY